MHRNLRWMIATAGVALVLAGCGSSSNKTTSPTTASNTPTTVSAAKTVSEASNATLGELLVNSAGKTLYHNTKEDSGTIVCTGACTTTWPPVTIPAGTTPTWASGLTGSKFSTVTRPDGTLQVTYAGWPLYTFAADTGAGSALGQGVGGIWYAVTPAGTNASSSGTGASTSSTSSAYGY